MGIENNFITNTSEQLNIKITPEEDFYVLNESQEEKCQINSDTACELSKFKVDIELNGNSNEHIFAPSENNTRFENFQNYFEQNQKHEQIKVGHMTEWTSGVHDALVLSTEKIRETEQKRIFQEGMNNKMTIEDIFSNSGLYTTLDRNGETFITVNGDKVNDYIFEKLGKEMLLDAFASGEPSDLVEKYGNILNGDFEFNTALNGRTYITMGEEDVYVPQELTTKEEVMQYYERKITSNYESNLNIQLAYSMEDVIDKFELEGTEKEIIDKIMNGEYPEVLDYIVSIFQTYSLDYIIFNESDVKVSPLSKEYLLSNVIHTAIQNQANQKIIQGLGLTDKEAYDVYYARLDKGSSITSMSDQKSFLESQKETLSYNQKILLTAINGDLLGSFYDYDRLNNTDGSGKIDFDYLTNEISKIHKINELSVTMLQSDVTTLSDLRSNINLQGSAEEIGKILNDRGYFQKLSDILGIDTDSIKKEFINIDTDKSMTFNEVVQKFNKLIADLYIDTNAVCKDVGVYGAWESHVLGIKDSFATSNNRGGGSHVVDGARAENGNIYFKNYGDIYQTNEATLDKAKGEYEKRVLHGVVLLHYFSEGKDKGGNIHGYQTKSGKIIERVIKDGGNSLDNSLGFLDGSYDSENKGFELNATEDETTYSYSFDSGLGVKLYSGMTDATLGSYKGGAIRYDFIENGNVFKSSITHISADLIGGGKQKGIFGNIVLGKVLEHEFEDKSIFKSYIKGDLIIGKSENEGERGYDKSFDYKGELEAGMSYQKDGFEIAGFTGVHGTGDNLTNISEFKDIAEHATVSKPYVGGYLGYSNENIEGKIGYKKDDFYGTKTKFAEIKGNITDDLSVSASYSDVKGNGFSSGDYRNFSVLADYSINKNLSVGVGLKHDEEFSNIGKNGNKNENVANINMKLRF